MMSAVVLMSARRSERDSSDRDPLEIAARSLAWLVPAVVAGAVRDVVLAGPAGLGLPEIADQAGCELIEAEDEAGRLRGSLARARCGEVLLMRAGFEPAGPLVEEIRSRGARAFRPALLLATPGILIERLWPGRVRPIGLLAAKAPLAMASTFDDAIRRCKGADRLRTRAQPIA